MPTVYNCSTTKKRNNNDELIEKVIRHNPYPHLKKIKASLLAINSADDQVNPPELGIMEQTIKQVTNGEYVLLPITDETRGHSTHTLAKLWRHHLAQFISN